MKKYNLIVAGGGFAGVSAALAAARQGLSVLLIDKSGCLGGAAVNCLVNPFMEYWTKVDNERVYLSRGIFSELIGELQKRNDCARNGMSFSEEDLKLILNRLTLAEGIDLLFHSYVFDVEKSDDTVKAVFVVNKSGKQRYEADFFIDATGDADLAVLCGCPTRLGREGDHLCQPMTLCFRMANVDMEEWKNGKQALNELYQAMRAEGKIKNPRENILDFHYRAVDGVVHFNSTRVIKLNPVDAADITRAEIEAREQVEELVCFLKNHSKAFANSELIMTAPEIGVRESRMIDGDYLLTGEELLACKRFDDVIAVGNYPIDIHNPEGTGTTLHYFGAGKYYSIPYRCLIPKNADNLLVAGRCISTDHEAQAAYRIMPICSTLGEAAGIAAAIAVEDGCQNNAVNIPELQKRLRDNNAYLGE